MNNDPAYPRSRSDDVEERLRATMTPDQRAHLDDLMSRYVREPLPWPVEARPARDDERLLRDGPIRDRLDAEALDRYGVDLTRVPVYDYPTTYGGHQPADSLFGRPLDPAVVEQLREHLATMSDQLDRVTFPDGIVVEPDAAPSQEPPANPLEDLLAAVRQLERTVVAEPGTAARLEGLPGIHVVTNAYVPPDTVYVLRPVDEPLRVHPVDETGLTTTVTYAPDLDHPLDVAAVITHLEGGDHP